MTPFKKAGYTKDTKFRVLRNYLSIKKNEIVKIYKDRGSNLPYFTTEDGRKERMYLPGSPEAEQFELEVYVETKKPEAEKPKIVQLIQEENGLLGLGSDGVIYRLHMWQWVKYADGI